MGTITTGTGLISGLNIQEIVTQLMALERRPLNQVKARIETVTQEKTAYTELSARLLAAKAAISRLARTTSFTVKKAASSNDSILTAIAGDAASLDSYTFRVQSLVTTHQLVSAGFASRTSPVGAGTITFETGRGNVAPTTHLSDLNGGAGVRTGVIRITDRAGGTADIDLRTATDIGEVLDAINSQSSARVRASIRGDSIVLTDLTGLASGTISVTDLGGGFTAEDLGIRGTSTGELVGRDLIYLSENTRLSRLNDGTGLRVSGLADDLRFTLRDGRQIDVNLSGNLRFGMQLAELNDGRGVRLGTIRITNRAGESKEIDLTGSQTIQDVIDRINAAGISVTGSLSGSRISLSDTSNGTGNFKVEDVDGGFAAADLGIRADVASNGVVGSAIHRVDTIGAVIRAIQYASGNDGALVASISETTNGLVFTDLTSGSGSTTVEALNGSKALFDLGLDGDLSAGPYTTRDLVAGLNTVLLASLNGGAGVDTGGLSITRTLSGGGTSTENIDVSGAQTLQDIVRAINEYRDGSNQQVFEAEVSGGGTTITIRDISGGSISSVSGATADALKLSATLDGRAVSGDLNLRYISENTLLSSLNGGAGISYGRFRITASDGQTATVLLSEATHKTVGDVIKAINSLGIGVTAQINNTGDGIELVDSGAGTQKLTVTEEGGGRTAASLNILGIATDSTINGSFAKTIEINGSETLDELVTKINSANAGVRASIINDGSPGAPYRLILTSTVSGTQGRINFSSTIPGLSFTTLSEARDAKLIVGEPGSSGAIVLTSSSNTIRNVVDGLTLELKGVSDNPVSVTVSRDIDQVVADVRSFVQSFNEITKRIDELTRYVPETNTKGILLGDGTVLRLRDRLYSRVTASVNIPGVDLHRLNEVGITIGTGAQLSFNEERFRQAFEAEPDAVRRLFTSVTTDSDGKTTIRQGIAARLEQEIDDLTQEGRGMLSLQLDALDDQIELYNRRVSDLEKILSQKESRLYKQFQAMETALAGLQNQQAAINALAMMASSIRQS